MATLSDRFSDPEPTKKSSGPNFDWLESPNHRFKGLSHNEGIAKTAVDTSKDRTDAATATTRVEVESTPKPAVDQVRTHGKTLDQIMTQPSRANLTLTQLYQQADHRDAKQLYTHPLALKALYDENAKYIDASGSGYITKTSLENILKDDTSLPQTRRLADALLVGYETLNNLSQYSDPARYLVPGAEWFTSADTATGISRTKMGNMVRALDEPTGEKEGHETALRDAGLVAIAMLGYAVTKNFGPGMVTELFRILYGVLRPASRDPKLAEAAEATAKGIFDGWKDGAKDIAKAVPGIAATSGIAYGVGLVYVKSTRNAERHQLANMIEKLDTK